MPNCSLKAHLHLTSCQGTLHTPLEKNVCSIPAALITCFMEIWQQGSSSPRCSSVWLALLFWTRCMWLVRVQAALWLETGGWRRALWQRRHARSGFAAHARLVTCVRVHVSPFLFYCRPKTFFMYGLLYFSREFLKTCSALESSHALPDYCVRSAGHFLFLQVRETNSRPHASMQSSLFPPLLSTVTACQVNIWFERSICSPPTIC